MNGTPISAIDSQTGVANASNFVDFFTTLGDVPGAVIETTDCFVRLMAPVPHPFFNFVHSLDSQACSHDLVAAVDKALAPFRARQWRMMWIVFPALDPRGEELAACLTAAGLRLFAGYPGMTIDLTALASEWQLPTDLSIERVTTAQAMRNWVEVQAACDGGAHQHIKEARVHYASLRGFDLGNHQQTYLARYHGQPAGCSILHVAAGVAGVYQVDTLPEARGHGIGRAMTTHAMLEGKTRGCDIGGLHATPMGLNLYRSICFVQHPPVNLFFFLPSR